MKTEHLPTDAQLRVVLDDRAEGELVKIDTSIGSLWYWNKWARGVASELEWEAPFRTAPMIYITSIKTSDMNKYFNVEFADEGDSYFRVTPRFV